MEYIKIPKGEFTSFINSCYKFKPKDLFIEKLQWKILIRSILKNKNILIVGPSGCGKTKLILCVSDVLKRTLFKFNMGSTQDPRSTLIGNTHFKDGTFFKKSRFIKGITTKGSIILLDELTRANKEAWNILMSPLDPEQRYITLDESENIEIINVEKDVSFIATANIGVEYTATRILDRAIKDRFPIIITMNPLNKIDETSLIKMKFPKLQTEQINTLADLVAFTRKEVKKENSEISTIISTRYTLEAAELLSDGFSFLEAIESSILPLYSNEGGEESERSYILKKVQSYDIKDMKNNIEDDDGNVFNMGDAL